MNWKILLIFIASVAFFSLAAKYRFHDSAHSIGMIKKGGGMARHPALLDKDRNSYMLIATAGVMPPYQGNARVVLEGDPSLKAEFYDSVPAVDLGIYRHPEFRENTYYDLRPKDRIALWVKIKRSQAYHQQALGMTGKPNRGAEPLCTQCEPAENDSATGARKEKGKQTAMDSGNPGSRWQGKGSGAKPSKGPALAFYDTSTNEPLLRIPIRFTGDAGGGDDDQ